MCSNLNRQLNQWSDEVKFSIDYTCGYTTDIMLSHATLLWIHMVFLLRIRTYSILPRTLPLKPPLLYIQPSNASFIISGAAIELFSIDFWENSLY